MVKVLINTREKCRNCVDVMHCWIVLPGRPSYFKCFKDSSTNFTWCILEYLDPCNMESLAKISSIWYVWQDSEYVYVIDFQNYVVLVSTTGKNVPRNLRKFINVKCLSQTLGAYPVHCMEMASLEFFWSVSPVFGLTTEIYLGTESKYVEK